MIVDSVKTYTYFRYDEKTGNREWFQTMKPFQIPGQLFVVRVDSHKYFTQTGKPRASIRKGRKTYYLLK